jgi:hypothetical protein
MKILKECLRNSFMIVTKFRLQNLTLNSPSATIICILGNQVVYLKRKIFWLEKQNHSQSPCIVARLEN